MKKIALLAMVTILVLAFGSLASAAPAQVPAQIPGNWYCHYYGQYYDNLTDEQKVQIATWQQQALEQRTQMIQKQVEWGYITQAQADQQISWLKQRMADGAYAYPMGMHGGNWSGRGMGGGRGCCG